MSARISRSVIPRFEYLLGHLYKLLACLTLLVLEVFVVLLIVVNSAQAATPTDPLEGINRPIMQFNSALDGAFFKPLGRTYQRIVPRAAKKGIGNFFNNLDDLRVIGSDLMQLNIKQAFSDCGRFVINSTIGIAGLFDVASSQFGLAKHNEGIGTALAHWNVGPGPYLVLPFTGPSTLREAAALGIENEFELFPLMNSENSKARDKLLILGAAHSRSVLLPLEDMVVGDRYTFIREMYLQNLEYRDSDGNLMSAFEEF